ncbi:MAG TPA: AAA family ATPase [Trueperaceae bacterium]
MSWQLRVLGETSLLGPGKRVAPERKTAALLAYLALEGPTGRSRLAGMLWPESGEERARGNLRQLLRRLRTACGADLLDTSDQLRLDPEVSVDVLRLQARAVTDGALDRAALMGELLDGHDYDDCPELLEWLIAQRERLALLRHQLLEEEIRRHEEQGDLQNAVRLAERLLEIDPLSEESCRKLMRLHYLSGDRSAALRAFRRSREALQRELGLEPLPETVALAREIERQASSLPEREQRAELPIALERPPFLVGREREWTAMESAWKAGKVIVVRGAAGMGKTRLMLEFVAEQGPFLRFAARPGDRSIPYALFSRGLGELFSGAGGQDLPDWARAELARLVPELARDEAPDATTAHKTRLLEAVREALGLARSEGRTALVVDDLHYADDASLEAIAYLLPDGGSGPAGLRWLLGYRAGELEAKRAVWVEEMLSGEWAVAVDPLPLDVDAIGRLIDSLSVPTGDIASGLARYTGGNPLFVVETLKSLAETGSLDLPFPERLPPSRQLGALLSRRLDRLSPAALRLARVAAVLEEAFDLEAAATILDSVPLELAEPLTELESAQLIGEEGFNHDLIRQAVLEGIPAAARRLLHQRAAAYLEKIPVPPGVVARHYLAAGDELRAAPFLKEAGDSAAAAYRLDDAANLYLQAAGLLERNGEISAAFATLSATVEILLKREYGSGHEELERSLFRLARTPAQLAEAWQTRSIFLQMVARARESEAAAREGYRHAVAAGDPGLQVGLLNNVVGALWLQDRIEETLKILAEAIELGERCEDPIPLSETLANMGVILDHLDRHRDAIEYHERSAALRARHSGRLGQVQVMGNLAVSQAELGLARTSLETAERMLLLLEEVHGAEEYEVHALVSAGTAHRDLGQLQSSLDCLQRAVAAAEKLNTWLVTPVRRHLAVTLTLLGRFDDAEEELNRAGRAGEVPDQVRSAILQVRAMLEQYRGGDPTPLLAEAEELLRTSGRPLKRGNLLLLQALALPPEESLAAALEAVELASEHELGGLLIAARTRCAQALLALGRTDEALAQADAAVALLDEYDPVDFYLPELLLTRYRILAAAGAEGADDQLRAGLEWVERAGAGLTAKSDRSSFLSANPVNRELLRTAASAGVATVPTST